MPLYYSSIVIVIEPKVVVVVVVVVRGSIVNTVSASCLQYPEVWVQSPSRTRIAQWLDVDNLNGLVHLNMTLTDEPEQVMQYLCIVVIPVYEIARSCKGNVQSAMLNLELWFTFAGNVPHQSQETG